MLAVLLCAGALQQSPHALLRSAPVLRVTTGESVAVTSEWRTDQRAAVFFFRKRP